MARGTAPCRSARGVMVTFLKEDGHVAGPSIPFAEGWNENGHYLGRPVDVRNIGMARCSSPTTSSARSTASGTTASNIAFWLWRPRRKSGPFSFARQGKIWLRGEIVGDELGTEIRVRFDYQCSGSRCAGRRRQSGGGRSGEMPDLSRPGWAFENRGGAKPCGSKRAISDQTADRLQKRRTTE